MNKVQPKEKNKKQKANKKIVYITHLLGYTWLIKIGV